MTERLRLYVTIPAEPKEVYDAWLDSKGHSEMTGSEAEVEPRINGAFTAWDGYVEGKTIELEPEQRIVQKWRTSDFPSGSKDSVVEIVLKRVDKGTKLLLIHTEIPDGQGEEYKEGWKEFYFKPMKEYFKSKKSGG
ncbi:MAG: SRPBCC domain-containing protein [Candidatus Thorarchaeota archaeon]